mmetsp:Transcript_53718/g.105048  ORF Transcript_53718/g.105048 Transcript_53718/m.105048 type:complete len:97 (-) Transcript_53718:1952-2242(-)
MEAPTPKHTHTHNMGMQSKHIRAKQAEETYLDREERGRSNDRLRHFLRNHTPSQTQIYFLKQKEDGKMQMAKRKKTMLTVRSSRKECGQSDHPFFH